MWQGRRRQIRRLENDVASAKAGQAELTRRLELFEKIAAAAGVELDAPPPAPADVPGPLAAAAQDPRQDAPVRLEVEGREFIAIVRGGEDADPREWWTAIKHLASRSRSAS